MREYAKVAPQFWTGKTGKKIREAGRDAQVVALYLITCPSANMLGLYYLPLPTLCHEIGCPLQGARKALRRVSEGGFAHYDEVSEHVWVPEMARFQLGEALAPSDKRIPWLKKQLQGLRNSPFFNAFLEKYAKPYHLGDVSPSEGASMPLRSQEQEQEIEHEKEQEQEGQENTVRPLTGARACEPSPNGFDALWSAHPGPKGPRGEALKVYRQVKPPAEALDALKAQVAYKAECDRRGIFCPQFQHLHRWIRKRRWEDELPPLPKSTAQRLWDEAQEEKNHDA